MQVEKPNPTGSSRNGAPYGRHVHSAQLITLTHPHATTQGRERAHTHTHTHTLGVSGVAGPGETTLKLP